MSEYSDWVAMRQVYPETEARRCWDDKVGNVLDRLPNRLQPRVKAIPHEIMYAPDRDSALEATADFSGGCGARYAQAVGTLTEGQKRVLPFFNFRAENWAHNA